MYRKTLAVLVFFVTLLGLASPAFAEDYVQDAASALAHSPVYVAAGANPSLTGKEMSALADRIRSGDVAIYIAVLPDAAGSQVGGYDNLPRAVGQRMGGYGVWGVVAGTHFRAGSSFAAGTGLDRGEANALAGQAARAENPRERGSIAPMLLDFVDRVHQSLRSHAAARSGGGGGRTVVGQPKKKSGAGHVLLVVLLVLVGIAALVLVAVAGLSFARRRREERQEREEFEQKKRTAQVRYAKVADDVLALDSTSKGNDQARASLSEATAAYTRAGSILDGAQNADDVADAATELSRAEYALADARAYLEGRDPVAERKEQAKRQRDAQEEADRLAREEAKRQADERRERERYEREVTPERYRPHERQSTTYNNYYGGGFYNGVYYGPGYYQDPFWNYLIMREVLDDDRHYDHGYREPEPSHESYEPVSTGGGGGDWSSSDSGGSSGGGGDWGGGSSSGGFDFGGGGGGGGGGDFGGSSGDGGGGGGDW